MGSLFSVFVNQNLPKSTKNNQKQPKTTKINQMTTNTQVETLRSK